MLQSLHVHNFALIEDAKVAFPRDLMCLPEKRGPVNPF